MRRRGEAAIPLDQDCRNSPVRSTVPAHRAGPSSEARSAGNDVTLGAGRSRCGLIRSPTVDTRTKIRWIFVALIGVFLIIAGVDDDNYGTSYLGAGILFLAVLGAWWHSELLRRKREAPQEPKAAANAVGKPEEKPK